MNYKRFILVVSTLTLMTAAVAAVSGALIGMGVPNELQAILQLETQKKAQLKNEASKQRTLEGITEVPVTETVATDIDEGSMYVRAGAVFGGLGLLGGWVLGLVAAFIDQVLLAFRNRKLKTGENSTTSS